MPDTIALLYRAAPEGRSGLCRWTPCRWRSALPPIQKAIWPHHDCEIRKDSIVEPIIETVDLSCVYSIGNPF